MEQSGTVMTPSPSNASATFPTGDGASAVPAPSHGGGWIAGWPALAAVALLALLARLYFLPELLQTLPYFTLPQQGVDAADYQKWAEAIAGGDGLSRSIGPFYLAPLYPYLLGAVLALTGTPAIATGLVLNAAAGVANALLAAGIARRLFGPVAGFVAGVLAGLNGSQMAAESMLLNDPLLAPLLLAGVWGVMRLREDLARGTAVGWGRMMGLGALLALPALGRASNLLPALGLGALVAAWLWRRQGRRGTLLVMAAALGGVLILAPPLARNGLLYQDWTLTTNGPLAFYVGNEPLSYGFNEPRSDFPQIQARIQERGQWWGELWKAHERRPGQWGAVLWRKTQMFFNAWDVPDNYNYHMMLREIPGFSWISIPPLVLFVLGAMGLAVTARSWRELLPLHLFLGLFALSILAVTVSGRYRLPFHDGLAIFAGGGVVWFATRWRERRWGVVVMALGIAVGAVPLFATRAPPYCVDGQCFPNAEGFPLRAPDYLNHALMLHHHHRPDDAVRLLERARLLFPNHLPVYETLTIMHYNGKRPNEALETATAGLERRASEVLLEIRLQTLIQLHRLPEADITFRTLLQMYPASKLGQQMLRTMQRPAAGGTNRETP
ncbi:MAG: hypothetical protein HQL51_07415 [Magnetococcales bacterium]|nr:hypothetical protein [Magnetococcales bacterium]